MLVSEFKERMGDMYPEEFLDVLPEECLDEDCCSPTEMTEVLTSLRCSNPRCPSKLKVRLSSMLGKMGVKGVGDKTARGFFAYLQVSNPLLIFAYEPDVDGGLTASTGLEVSRGIYDQISTRKVFTLGEYVKIAQLPNVQNSALQIFEGYSDLAKAYEDIESGGVEFIRKRLDIKKGELDGGMTVSIRALKIYESLMTFKTDLFDALPYVTIFTPPVDSSVGVLRVCCSTAVGEPYKSKEDFYASINNKFVDKLHIEFIDGVSKKIDFLVWEGGSDPEQFLRNNGRPAQVTGKVKKVRAYNSQYEDSKERGTLKDTDHLIPIYSAMEFISALNNIE